MSTQTVARTEAFTKPEKRSVNKKLLEYYPLIKQLVIHDGETYVKVADHLKEHYGEHQYFSEKCIEYFCGVVGIYPDDMEQTAEVDKAQENTTQPTNDVCQKIAVIPKKAILLGGIATGLGAAAAAPFIISGLGFTAAGIAGGSIAAKMMSVLALANGGTIAAGSLVAGLQSAGVVGLTTTASVAVGGAAASATAGGMSAVNYIKSKDKI